MFSVISLQNLESSLGNSVWIVSHNFGSFLSTVQTLGLFGRVSADWHLKTKAPVLGHCGFIITDPPEQCPGEFTTLVLTGLGVGSGQYIGVGGE